MRVLFVSKGDEGGLNISPFIKAQAESIRKLGISLDHFPIKGKGLIGYFSSMLAIRKYLKTNHYDVIHAHYVLSGWSALMGSGGIPVVLSLMGSDVQGDRTGVNKVKLSTKYLTYLTYLIQPFIKAIISKSERIEKYIYLKKKSFIVPNGIDLNAFRPFDNDCRQELNLDPNIKYVLFLGNKEFINKNFKLVQKAVSLISDPDLVILNPYPVSHQDIPKYMNAADVLLLSSFSEGSPNVVKEAMACNCPVVATDVGDVRWLFGGTEGYYISSFDAKDFAEKITLAINYSKEHKRTNGRDRIIELDLDSEIVARKIIEIYKQVLKGGSHS